MDAPVSSMKVGRTSTPVLCCPVRKLANELIGGLIGLVNCQELRIWVEVGHSNHHGGTFLLFSCPLPPCAGTVGQLHTLNCPQYSDQTAVVAVRF